ncbi:hypothetical protein CCR95_14335 [Thiocystis minor]|uniref:helix-turn-helix domain-containing protein n=1 Tax=Thiocystis minor TaxID=61597 RepID=UPI001913DA29|nr:hypothetical protein [Thiocystis minor]
MKTQRPRAKQNAPLPPELQRLRDRRLRRQAAATYLGVTPETLSNWAIKGTPELAYIRIGRTTFYDIGELDRFLERQTRRPQGTQPADGGEAR